MHLNGILGFVLMKPQSLDETYKPYCLACLQSMVTTVVKQQQQQYLTANANDNKAVCKVHIIQLVKILLVLGWFFLGQFNMFRIPHCPHDLGYFLCISSLASDFKPIYLEVVSKMLHFFCLCRKVTFYTSDYMFNYCKHINFGRFCTVNIFAGISFHGLKNQCYIVLKINLLGTVFLCF